MSELQRLERTSALANAVRAPGHDGANGERRLRIAEVRGWQLLQITGFATTSVALESAVELVLGTRPPAHVGEAFTCNGRRLLRTGPEQYWLITPHGDPIASDLGRHLPPDRGVTSALSHSRTRISIEGPEARLTLAAGIALDLHPGEFGVNRFALTSLHHTPVLLDRVGEARYEIYCMRTFAVCVWDWLTDAALVYGYSCNSV